MINIAICDDSLEELETISLHVSRNLKELDIPFKISCFSEGEDCIEHINSSKDSFDIIFLDIYMQFSNGIDIAKKIRDFDKECKIIFITSSKEHAIDSYDARAFHYILKPINEVSFGSIIKMAIESLNNENKEVVIKNKKGNYRIIYKDILYVESKARVLNIYLRSSEIISFYSKLEDFIQSLKDERFIKSHKSFVVNMDYILKIENNHIFMRDNIKIPISSANVAVIKEKYYSYMLSENDSTEECIAMTSL